MPDLISLVSFLLYMDSFPFTFLLSLVTQDMGQLLDDGIANLAGADGVDETLAGDVRGRA
jgi:hypothetical protein